MKSYYEKGLAAERLKKVYDIAPPRTRQYLQAEIDFVLKNINPDDSVLELGCGFGRVLEFLAPAARHVVGIDTSQDSLNLARQYLDGLDNVRLLNMDASELAFNDNSFEKVVCIQNGISAFHVDPGKLLWEAIRVTKKGGMAIFSSYSEKFWDSRLVWFKLQSEHGLLGEIDWERTKDGELFCRDGFHATTFGPDDFRILLSRSKFRYKLREIDESSLFCLIEK